MKIISKIAKISVNLFLTLILKKITERLDWRVFSIQAISRALFVPNCLIITFQTPMTLRNWSQIKDVFFYLSSGQRYVSDILKIFSITIR